MPTFKRPMWSDVMDQEARRENQDGENQSPPGEMPASHLLLQALSMERDEAQVRRMSIAMETRDTTQGWGHSHCIVCYTLWPPGSDHSSSSPHWSPWRTESFPASVCGALRTSKKSIIYITTKLTVIAHTHRADLYKVHLHFVINCPTIEINCLTAGCRQRKTLQSVCSGRIKTTNPLVTKGHSWTLIMERVPYTPPSCGLSITASATTHVAKHPEPGLTPTAAGVLGTAASTRPGSASPGTGTPSCCWGAGDKRGHMRTTALPRTTAPPTEGAACLWHADSWYVGKKKKIVTFGWSTLHSSYFVQYSTMLTRFTEITRNRSFLNPVLREYPEGLCFCSLPTLREIGDSKDIGCLEALRNTALRKV